MSKLTLEDVDIVSMKKGKEFFGVIRRKGPVKHFQPTGTHTRIFSVEVGPCASDKEAIADAEATVEAGTWER